DLSGSEAHLPDPHQPLDHLGLRRLHAAVPAHRRFARGRLELPDGRVRVHRGLLALGLRAGRCDLAPDAAHRRRSEHLLRAPDGEDGGGGSVSAAVETAPATATRAVPRAATIRRARRRRLRRAAWNVVGLAVFVVLVFPVFWMISTSLKPTRDINAF